MQKTSKSALPARPGRSGLAMLLVALVAILALPPLRAALDDVLGFPFGSGSGEFGVSPAGTDGPREGPLALLVSGGDGLLVLDSRNQRVVQLDAAGAVKRSVLLPVGRYKDLARDAAGRVWVADEENRAVRCIEKGVLQKGFKVEGQPGLPVQFDALACAGDDLYVGDFATRGLYAFAADGHLRLAASWPLALGLCADREGRVCFLAAGEDERHERLVRRAADGKTSEVLVRGSALLGARLLGFLGDGRGVGCGLVSYEPLVRELFVIAADGRATAVATLTTPLLFATRPGAVASDAVWFNVTGLAADRLELRRFRP